MSLTKFVGLLAGSTLTLTGVSYGANEVNNDTASQIAALQAEVKALKEAKGEQWLTEQRAAQVRGIVQDVLADADTRASLQNTAATSGYDNGFFISSADGNFKLKITALEQIRFVYNSQYNPGVGNVPEKSTWGFENRRTQVWFTGNVVDPTWTYVLGMSYNAQNDPYYNMGVGGTNTFGLGYAYVRKTFDGFADGHLWIQGGQFSVPWTQQSQLWSAGNTQAGEYSTFEYLYGVGLGTGMLAGWNNDFLKLQFSWTNQISPFVATAFAGAPGQAWNSLGNASIAIAGRADVKLAGSWAQFDNESSFKGQEFGCKIGGAIIYDNGRAQNAGASTPFGLTADAMLDFGGANVMAQFAYMDDVFGGIAGGTIIGGNGGDTWGFNVQGGFFFTDEFEVFGGWTWNSADIVAVAGRTDGSVFSVGGNWYLGGKPTGIKATVAVLIPVSIDTAGTGGDPATVPMPAGQGWNVAGSNNISVVGQLQLSF